MADLFQPSAEFSAHAWIKNFDQYTEMYERSINDPEGFWAEVAEDFHWFKKWDKVRDYNFDRREGKVFIEWFKGAQDQHHLQRPRSSPRDPRRPGRHHLGRQRAGHRSQDHLQGAARAGLQVRQRAQGQRRQEGRPRQPLHADDPRAGRGHAGLRPHRRHPLDRVRRVLAGLAGRPHHRLHLHDRRHPGHRSPRREEQRADEDQRRHRRREGRGQRRQADQGREDHRRQAHRHGRPDAGRPRRLVARRDGQGQRRLPVRGDGRGRPAVHPLHLGLDRQAEGRAAQRGRLHGLHGPDPQVHLRLPRRRRLLVHRRHRLGHRPLVHRLRPAAERRDLDHVRGCPDLPRAGPLLEGLRQVQGQPVLHRADRDPRAHGAGREVARRAATSAR